MSPTDRLLRRRRRRDAGPAAGQQRAGVDVSSTTAREGGETEDAWLVPDYRLAHRPSSLGKDTPPHPALPFVVHLRSAAPALRTFAGPWLCRRSGTERKERTVRSGARRRRRRDLQDRQTDRPKFRQEKKHRGIALVLRESAAFVHPFPLFSPLPCSLLMSSARTMGHGTLLHFRESWVLLQRGPPLPFLYFRQSSCPFSHLLRTPLRHARPSPMLLATPRNSLEGCRDTAWAC